MMQQQPQGVFIVLVEVVLVLSCLFQDGQCIVCQRCSSVKEPKKCTEGTMPAVPCDAGTNYCIKYVGKPPVGKLVVFRDCSTTDGERTCNVKHENGQDIRYCHDTCDQDNCNGGPALVVKSKPSSQTQGGSAPAALTAAPSIEFLVAMHVVTYFALWMG